MRKSRYDFRILYEHKAREMESIALLSLELESRGFSVDVRPCNGLGKKWIEPATVLVVPYCRTNADLQHWGRFAKGASSVVNLQWEQVYTYDADVARPCIYDPIDNACSAIHLCWSDSSKDRLVDGGISASNAVVVGPIHMDFYSLRNKDVFFMTKDEIGRLYSLDPSKRWILFCSNFSGSISKREAERRSRENSAFCSRYELEAYTKDAVLDWISRFIADNGDCEFIYRPHPFEKSDIRLEVMSKDFPAFRVIDGLSVRQWINASDCSLFWTSTSAVDAFLSGSRHGILRPFPVPSSIDMVVFEGTSFISTYEGFSDFLNTDIEGNCALKEEVVRKFYDFKPDWPAYKRIANFLEKLLLEGPSTSTDAFAASRSVSLKERFSHSYLFDLYERALAFIRRTRLKAILCKSAILKQKMDDAYMRVRDFISYKELEKEKKRISEAMSSDG